MTLKAELPVLVFGTSTSGYGLQGASDHLPRQAVDSFLQFVKAIRWRPAKLEEPDTPGLALIPCPDGLFVCRLSDAGPDSHGRRPTMLVEGILCAADESVWQPWLDLTQWPRDVLKGPSIAPIAGRDGGKGAAVAVGLPNGWTPDTGGPLVFLPEQLIAMPHGWGAGPARSGDVHLQRSAIHPGDTQSSLSMSSVIQSPVPPYWKKSIVWLIAAVALGLGLLVGYIGGSKPLAEQRVALQMASERSKQLQQEAIRVGSELSAVRAENARLQGEIKRWQEVVGSLGESPGDVGQALLRLYDEMDDLRTIPRAGIGEHGAEVSQCRQAGCGATSLLLVSVLALGLALGLVGEYVVWVRPLQKERALYAKCCEHEIKMESRAAGQSDQG